MIFDLTKGFPLLTTKKIPFKTVLRELLWFISGSTDNEKLNKQKVHIWDKNASKEFLENQGLNYEENDLGPVYGFQWRHFGAKYIDNKTDYSGQGHDQLQNVIDLIKSDPTSRRIILSAWNPCDLHKMALPPCHVMVQFYINDGFIDAQMYQRSGDMFLGVPFNIASYAFLLHIVGSITGYKPRYLHHVLGDAHVYIDHIDAIGVQLTRIPNDFPKLVLKQQIKDINNIDETLFELENYNYFPSIKVDMIA
jgi:thymidylate synthase